MKLGDLNKLVNEMLAEAARSNFASKDTKQHQLYRKSKLHPDMRAKKQADLGIKNAIPNLSRILMNIERYPAVETTHVDPKTKKAVTTRYENQRRVAIGAAQRIIHGMNVSRADVNTLGKFLVDVGALPGVPLPVIIRGLGTLFVQNST